MSMISVKFEGIDGFELRLSRLKKNLIREAKAAIIEATSLTARDARRNAPFDTGHLRRTVQWRLEKGGFLGIVAVTANYAAHVEFGTRNTRPQPYLAPAFDKNAKKFDAILRKIAKRV